MRLHIQLNPRNLSNVPASPTYGFKIPIRYIRRLADIDPQLASHLSALASGRVNTYTRDVRIVWPMRNAPDFRGHISYTYTGLTLASGAYSSQAHVAVTHHVWTPMIRASLTGSVAAEYFQGVSSDLIVISDQ